MRLNSLIADCIDVRKVTGDLGIEIETELNKRIERAWENFYWSLKGDGSLRGNGYEFVLKKPIDAKDLAKSVEDWKKNLGMHKVKCNKSDRTSIHVHRNVQNFSVLQGVTAISAYWLMEPFLVDFCGSSRKGNNFCLTLQDADGIHNQLIQGIKDGKTFSNINEDFFRYASLNIAAINRFGSLENRLMRGTDDVNEIVNWASAFNQIIDKSRMYSNPLDLIKNLDKHGPKVMLESLLDKNLISYFNSFSSSPAPEQKLMENALYINDIAEAKKSWDFTKDKGSLKKDFDKLLKVKMDYLITLGWASDEGTVDLAKTMLNQDLAKKKITDFNEFLTVKVKEEVVQVNARRAAVPIFDPNEEEEPAGPINWGEEEDDENF